MKRAMTLMAKIVSNAREAAELLERAEDKQAAVEIRFAAEAVIEGNKNESHKRNTQERQSPRD